MNKLIGRKFNSWTVIGKPQENSHRYLLCKCKCGTVRELFFYALTSGSTKSCGCLSYKSKKRTNKRDEADIYKGNPE